MNTSSRPLHPLSGALSSRENTVRYKFKQQVTFKLHFRLCQHLNRLRRHCHTCLLVDLRPMEMLLLLWELLALSQIQHMEINGWVHQ